MKEFPGSNFLYQSLHRFPFDSLYHLLFRVCFILGLRKRKSKPFVLSFPLPISSPFLFALPISSLFFFALLLRSSSPFGGCEPKGDANRRGMRTKAATRKEVVIQRDANQRARKGEGMRTEGIPVFSLLP